MIWVINSPKPGKGEHPRQQDQRVVCEAKGTWGGGATTGRPHGWSVDTGAEWAALRPRRQEVQFRKSFTANAQDLGLHHVFLTLTTVWGMDWRDNRSSPWKIMVTWIESHGWPGKGEACAFLRDLVGKSDRHLASLIAGWWWVMRERKMWERFLCFQTCSTAWKAVLFVGTRSTKRRTTHRRILWVWPKTGQSVFETCRMSCKI